MYPHERTLVNEMRGRPFALLGVNNDGKISRVKEAIKKNNINWRSWYDGKGGPIVKEFGIRSFPTIFLVDHTGVIRYKNLRGPKLDEALQLLVAEAEGAGMSGAPVIVAKRRTYRDVSGKHSVYATFKAFRNNQVVLLKKDGSKVVLPLDKLSKSDQQYLEKNGYLTETVSTAAPSSDPEVESGTEVVAGQVVAGAEDATGTEDDATTMREFADSTGKFKVKATLVELKDDMVVLRKESGEEISLPLERLSETDQEYVREHGQ